MAAPELLDEHDEGAIIPSSTPSSSSISGTSQRSSSGSQAVVVIVDHVEVSMDALPHPQHHPLSALETSHCSSSSTSSLAPEGPDGRATGDPNHHRGSADDTVDEGRNHGSNNNGLRLARALRAGLLRKNQDYVRIKIPRRRGGGGPAGSRRGILGSAGGTGGGDPLPQEWWKTGVAFVYTCSCLVLTTGVITMVHERVPSQVAPLPDKFFELFPRMPGAFTVTEINGMLLVGLWFVQWLFLKHRAIIGRRFFFLQGTLYLYRCVTMYLTVLPAPGPHLKCAPKLYGDAQEKVYRMLKMVSGGGLSITGSHIMCGDYLYSGHTVMLTLTFLFIREYSPRNLWWYHLICWLLSVVGAVCILLAHDHYSIDVVVAYFITTRIFYWYHTMANNQSLRGSPHNYLSHSWWTPIFNFLERNVRTTVPCTFAWPIPVPTSCSSTTNPCRRYSMVQSTREE